MITNKISLHSYSWLNKFKGHWSRCPYFVAYSYVISYFENWDEETFKELWIDLKNTLNCYLKGYSTNQISLEHYLNTLYSSNFYRKKHKLFTLFLEKWQKKLAIPTSKHIDDHIQLKLISVLFIKAVNDHDLHIIINTIMLIGFIDGDINGSKSALKNLFDGQKKAREAKKHTKYGHNIQSMQGGIFAICSNLRTSNPDKLIKAINNYILGQKYIPAASDIIFKLVNNIYKKVKDLDIRKPAPELKKLLENMKNESLSKQINCLTDFINKLNADSDDRLLINFIHAYCKDMHRINDQYFEKNSTLYDYFTFWTSDFLEDKSFKAIDSIAQDGGIKFIGGPYRDKDDKEYYEVLVNNTLKKKSTKDIRTNIRNYK